MMTLAYAHLKRCHGISSGLSRRLTDMPSGLRRLPHYSRHKLPLGLLRLYATRRACRHDKMIKTTPADFHQAKFTENARYLLRASHSSRAIAGHDISARLLARMSYHAAARRSECHAATGQMISDA